MSRPTNTQFALAVHALTLLGGAQPGEVLSSEVLSGSIGASPVHVRRVLGRLRAAGLVLSRPGARGGWQLAEASQQVNLAQVWRAVQGEDQVLGLHGPNPDCTVGRRIQTELVAIDRRAARAIEDELKATTLSTLVRQTAAAKPSRA
jgi:Rrf2 family protein